MRSVKKKFVKFLKKIEKIKFTKKNHCQLRVELRPITRYSHRQREADWGMMAVHVEREKIIPKENLHEKLNKHQRKGKLMKLHSNDDRYY